MSLWKWPWTKVRGARPRRMSLVKRARLALELLEDRLAPSASPLPALNHEQWAQFTFTVDEVTVANKVKNAKPQSGPAANATGGFGDLINLDEAAAYGYTGTGYTVAVIDTGIDYTHPDLGGTWGTKVIAGWDFVNDDSNPMDDNGHGTHVAGIIGSTDPVYAGVAPGVNLIALKVLDANGSGSFGDVELALQWVVSHQAQYNIVAVNLSLGAGNYQANPYTFLEDEFQTLIGDGVFIAAASGNSYYSYGSQQGLGYPAISSQVAAVGAVWAGNFGKVTWQSGAIDYTTAADRITSFTQRNSGLDIFAPGAMITSTYPGGGFTSMAGTSMATPVVAGAAAILHQALDANGQSGNANQGFILDLMQDTGKAIVDGDDESDNVANTFLSFKRLDLNAALAAIQTVNVAPVLAPIANVTMSAGASKTIALSGTDANSDPITYTARVVGGTGGSSQAYQLDQQLGLNPAAADYFYNIWGQNEKWLIGTGNIWYCLMPNGDLRQWAGSMAATLLPANLIASLGVNFYNDPSLLWSAQPAGPNVTLTVVGNQLTIQPPAGYYGTFTVEVTASDGQLSSTQTFTVTTAANQAPVISPINNFSVRPGFSRTVTIAANDADGNPLTYSARVLSGDPTLVTLSLTGNRLTVRAPTSYAGSVVIEVAASDGSATGTKTFTVTLPGAVRRPRK